MSHTNCIFCCLPVTRIIAENTYFLAILDKFPISKGHTLIIPKRHILSFFHLNEKEFVSLYPFINEIKTLINKRYLAKGFNIGVNDGEVAGQTINHLHIHLIPRYNGDVSNPKGGIRWMFPDKADYWS